MKTFEVVLTKSYLVKIKAENELDAKAFSEFFTNDIQNISSESDEIEHKFMIENIECKINEATKAVEVYEVD